MTSNAYVESLEAELAVAQREAAMSKAQARQWKAMARKWQERSKANAAVLRANGLELPSPHEDGPYVCEEAGPTT